jgi:hypothetical protein
MTLAITISIILAAIVFTAIVGSLAWAIMTSRDEQATAPREASSNPRAAGTQRRPTTLVSSSTCPAAGGRSEPARVPRQDLPLERGALAVPRVPRNLCTATRSPSH